MSPEQARGYDVDRRCDIWAFGVILYEMMTGERLFQGKTAADTLAAVLHKEPDWDALDGDHSPLLVQLCRRCLEKEANQRLRDIGEVRVALEGSATSIISLATSSMSTPGATASVAKKGGPIWLVAALALGLVGALFAGWQGLIGPDPLPSPLVRATSVLPEGVSVNLFPSNPGHAVVSPNGRYICFVEVDSTAAANITIQDFETGEFWTMEDTRSASYPFWSHDSSEIAYADASGMMRRKAINGGPAINIVSATNMKGGSWNQFDQIIYAPTHASVIMMTTSDGAEPVALTNLASDDGVRSHRLPQWLPDGKHFLYTAVKESQVNVTGTFDCLARIVEVESGKSVDLMPTQSSALIARGHLLYQDSTLMARAFDMSDLSLAKSTTPLLSNVGILKGAHLSVFSANESNLLAFSPAASTEGLRQLVRYDSSGEKRANIAGPFNAVSLSVSNNGRFISWATADEQNGTMDTWIYDTQRDFDQQLTFGNESEWMGVFTPDDKHLVLTSDSIDSRGGLYKVAIARGGELEELVVGDGDYLPGSFTPDGAYHYATVLDSTLARQMIRVDMVTKETIRVHPNAQYAESGPAVSPDGKWLAYESRESGVGEIFVEKINNPEERWRVSTSGGGFVTWAPDGDVIYYETQRNELVAVPISYVDDNVVLSPSRVILKGINSSFVRSYDIDRSTGDLIVQRKVSGEHSRYVNLVIGWDRLLEQQ